MLDLSARAVAGGAPYFVPVAHTRAARQRLGPSPLLAPEMACVLDDDARVGPGQGAQRTPSCTSGLRNYTNNLLNHGFDERDIVDGGSDRLIDAVVPQGDAERIAAVAREHLDAGANHVCLQTAGVEGIPRAEWTALAAALGIKP